MSSAPASEHPDGVAFLLAQLGQHAATLFAEQVATIELSPPHAGILRAIATEPGRSQQALSAQLGMLPSRVVVYVDELEERALFVGTHAPPLIANDEHRLVLAAGQPDLQRPTLRHRLETVPGQVPEDLGHAVALNRDNKLAVYEPEGLASCDPLFRDFDREHRVICTGANCTALVFNSQLVNASDAPRRWEDLTNPKWSGQISVGHPGYSGAMGAWVVEMEKRFGWSYFEALARNKPLVGRSLVEPPNTIASGERKLGLGPSNLILTLKERGRADEGEDLALAGSAMDRRAQTTNREVPACRRSPGEQLPDAGFDWLALRRAGAAVAGVRDAPV